MYILYSIIEQFNQYSISHPNLSHCWLKYIALKKRHYDDNLIKECTYVLNMLDGGSSDFTQEDIFRILLYKRSVSII